MSTRPSARRPAGPSATRTRPARTTATDTNQKQRISLAGSTAVVSDYFHYAINCILYQRAIYDQADFKMVKKFGLQMMVVEDEVIADYIRKIVDQVRVWLVQGKISRLVLVIRRKDNGETIERWEFDVILEDEPAPDEPGGAPRQPSACESSKPKLKAKSIAEIQSDIQVIIRQIIATVSFLPIPESARTFKVLAYTQRVGQDEAAEWNDSEAFDITEGAERVKLKSFSTAVHRVDTAVDYKMGESII